ncbi:secreted protein containing Type II and III secretion system domain protein [Candidatus Magnetobacterium bavaricum]|uniref:Secreted protein containing Type II and III secretion system domain protein n=1 Tax=Candidatus Magnetobacterium bavaricum TaxID=29290 RepID=A0A0F3GYQ7_9BACT|nr:secreted protein containing Type II and III secretion system domain protein [Candidatus Magnetobacterium bavaricum]
MEMLGRPMKMYKGKELILSVSLFVMMMAYGCSSTGGLNGGVKPDLQERDGVTQADAKGPNFLKSIDIEDYMVRLEAEKGFEYWLAPPSDPFKIVATLKAVEPGVYRDRIISGKEGIGEVVLQPSVADGTLNVEITLTSPFEIVHKLTGNVLTIGMRKEPVESNKVADAGSAPNSSKDWVAIKPEEVPQVKSHDSHDGQPMDGQLPATAIDKAMESHPAPVEDSSVREAKNIIGVSFKREKDAVKVIIQGDGTLKVRTGDGTLDSRTADLAVSDKIIIDINDVRIAAKLPREVAQPLKALNWEQSKDGVRMVLELQKEILHGVLTVDDTIIVSMMVPDTVKGASTLDASTLDAAKTDTKTKVVGKNVYSTNTNDTIMPENSKTRESERASKTDAKKEGIVEIQEGTDYGIEGCAKKLACGTQNKISINLQNAPLPAVLRFLAEESGCDIMVDEDIKGSVTLQIKNAAWINVLTLLQRVHKLGCEVAGNIIRIGKWDTLRENRKAEIKAKEEDDAETKRMLEFKQHEEKAKLELSKLKHMECRLQYVPAEDIEKGIKGVVDKKPALKDDGPPRTGGLYGDGLPGDKQAAEELKKKQEAEDKAKKEDNSGALVRMSNRGKTYKNDVENIIIVEDAEPFLKSIKRFVQAMDKPKQQVLIEAKIVEINSNIQDSFGINWGFFSKSFDKTGAIGVGQGAGVTGQTYLSDMPSAVFDLGRGVALGFIDAKRTLGLDLRLQAMENSSNGKVLTSPRLLTVNNEQAKITQGQQIPYPVMNPQGVVSAAFKPVSVSITITPKITPGKLVNLSVDITKEDLIDFVSIGGSQTPRTAMLTETTKVVVKDGETLVLGGMFKQNILQAEEGMTGLKDIPILGWLFKTDSRTNTESEYLIFITPRIVQREYGNESTECHISELP